ncbi:MAG: UDP-N-acetylglucosamine 1-carboxyvinyltransferase [Candidatus Falkowbacteria bacterium]
MANYIINGGKKLTGSITTNSAKNSAVSILCATVMIKGKTTLVDVPEIEEVKRIMEILNSIGVKVAWSGKNKLTVENFGKINLKNINKKSVRVTRSSFMLIGALSGILKTFSFYKPGGCKLGARTLTPHILGFENLGLKISENKKYFTINTSRRKSAEFTMYEMSDTGTENIIMTACTIPGKTIIKLAASNYMVQDLCYFLQKAGVKIKGIGSATLEITGVKKLKPVSNYSIMPDPIESMAFIATAIVTQSKLTIKNCPIDFLQIELEKLKIMGQQFKILKKHKSKNKKFDLIDLKIIPSKLVAPPDKIHAQPYPGLNIDNLHFFVPILLRAKGKTLVHDWVYENRAIYATELVRLGAKIDLLDPHRLIVEGPVKLKSAEIICPPALRPAMNILICMLATKGKSTLRNLYSIKRGYEDIIERLKKLGADIVEIK